MAGPGEEDLGIRPARTAAATASQLQVCACTRICACVAPCGAMQDPLGAASQGPLHPRAPLCSRAPLHPRARCNPGHATLREGRAQYLTCQTDTTHPERAWARCAAAASILPADTAARVQAKQRVRPPPEVPPVAHRRQPLSGRQQVSWSSAQGDVAATDGLGAAATLLSGRCGTG